MATQNTEENKKAFLENLVTCNKNITEACKMTNIDRQTYYNWIEKDKDFKEKCDDANEAVHDHVVSKLHEKINGITMAGKDGTVYTTQPDITGIIFYLKTQCKDRGYVERQEITGKDGDAIKTQSKLDYKLLSDGDLKVIQELLEKAQKLKE